MCSVTEPPTPTRPRIAIPSKRSEKGYPVQDQDHRTAEQRSDDPPDAPPESKLKAGRLTVDAVFKIRDRFSALMPDPSGRPGGEVLLSLRDRLPGRF